MNFQAVLQANGQHVTMFATFNEVGGVGLTQNQKQVSKCIITDDVGEKHIVRLYGTMPTPALLNTRQQFTLSSYQGKTQQGQPYTGYSGFWNSNAQVGREASQGSPQASQNAPGATNAPKTGDTVCGRKFYENDVEIRKSVVCALFIASGHQPDIKEVERWMAYIKYGKDPDTVPEPDKSIQKNPGYVGDDPPPIGDSEIPF